MSRNYCIVKGVWIDLDQIRRAEFGGDGMILITWQDGSTEKFDPGERWAEKAELKKSMAEHVRDDLWRKLESAPPLLIPASPGHELVHFDTGWRFNVGVPKDPDPATFDIASVLIREPVIAWEIHQPKPSVILSEHQRNAIGSGRLRQYQMDDQTGRNWTALVLPSGALCAEVREFGYFHFDVDDKPIPNAEAHDGLTVLEHFENIAKWIEYIRHDWKAYLEWHKAAQLEWEKQKEAAE